MALASSGLSPQKSLKLGDAIGAASHMRQYLKLGYQEGMPNLLSPLRHPPVLTLHKGPDGRRENAVLALQIDDTDQIGSKHPTALRSLSVLAKKASQRLTFVRRPPTVTDGLAIAIHWPPFRQRMITLSRSQSPSTSVSLDRRNTRLGGRTEKKCLRTRGRDVSQFLRLQNCQRTIVNDGLVGAQIPDLVRLATICDIYSALIERRPYRPPLAPAEAFKILRGMDGKLEHALVRAFAKIAEQCATAHAP